MSKIVKAIRIRTDRADLLREKAIELTIKKKEHITEADLVNFMIDALTERIEIDQNGLFIRDEDENEEPFKGEKKRKSDYTNTRH